ncbi:hypothetical protein IAU59_006724 [Kwoniella sp. CBS 9459]
MDSLTPDQARALWAAGGFLVITDLPEGSEFGIDGTFHIVRRFSGIKFVPPGLHLITWSINSPPPSSSASSSSASASLAASIATAGPSNVPIRHGLMRHFSPKQRVVLHFDRGTESVIEHAIASERLNPNGNEIGSVISDDHLRTLDKEMAPYPFSGLESWKHLTEYITPDVLGDVLGQDGLVDGMTSVEGEEEDSDSKEMKNEMSTLSNQPQPQGQTPGQGQGQGYDRTGKKMKFVRFGLKRSWRDGAVGEEVTRFSRDKSWLLGHVVADQLEGDLTRLLGQLQLSFVLLLHLSSYSALLVYKRLLTIICQSSSFLLTPSTYLPDSFASESATTTSSSSSSRSLTTTKTKKVWKMYTSFLAVLSEQIEAIPDGSFDTELPELDAFFQDQIDSLRGNISAAIHKNGLESASSCSEAPSSWSEAEKEEMEVAWRKLNRSAKKWGWDIGALDLVEADEESDEEEEEGEYAPVIVEL